MGKVYRCGDGRDPPVVEFGVMMSALWGQMTRDREQSFKVAQKLARERYAEVQKQLEEDLSQ